MTNYEPYADHAAYTREIKKAADRIEALEAALRIAIPCLEDVGFLPQARCARAALAPEQDK